MGSNIMNEIGYEPKTTFWEDFSIADKFGKNAVIDTFKRAFIEWSDNAEYLTELVMVLNHKTFQYDTHNAILADLYSDLWAFTYEYACEHIKGAELDYFYTVTD